MKIRYFVSAIGILVFTAAAFFFLHQEIASENSHSELINISGRQRMFSQKIPKLALMLATTKNENEREIIRRDLDQSVKDMSREHEELVHGIGVENLRDRNLERINDIYFKEPDHLNKKSDQFIGDAQKLLKEKGAIDPNNKYVQRLVIASPSLLASFEKIVTLHQIQNEDINIEINRISLYFIIVMILIQIGLTFFVLYPSVKQLESDGQRLEEMERFQRNLSKKDGLTNLDNRRSFDEIVKGEWAIAERTKRPMSIIMSDIDFFKKYNDHYGHQAGDECLKAVASEMKLTFKRPGDYIARYGGEEFVVVLTETDEEDALKMAEQLRSNISDLKLDHPESDASDVVTISLGVATSKPNITSYKKLIAKADEALYLAKNSGRNRVELFSNESD